MSEWIPHCASGYDVGDVACDGDAKADDDDDKGPCPWRERCAALKHHISRTSKTAADYVVDVIIPASPGQEEQHAARPKQGLKTFNALADGLISKYGVSGGVATRPDGKKSKKAVAKKPKATAGKRHPTKAARVRGNEATKKRWMDDRKELLGMWNGIIGAIMKALPDRRLAQGEDMVVPGRMFVINRVKTSGYISMYCKTKRGRDVPVVMARLKTRSMKLDVFVPVLWDEFDVGKATVAKLSPCQFDDGRFKTVMRGIDKDLAGLVAETVVRHVKTGKIELSEI